MSNYDIIEKTPISLVEINEVVSTKDEEEQTYREKKTSEYLKEFVKLDYDKYLEAKKDLEGLDLDKLEESDIIKILDLMPSTGTELRAIVSNGGTIIVDEEAKMVLDILKKYQ